MKSSIKFILLLPCIGLLASCASPDNYIKPSVAQTHGTTIQGYSKRTGMLSADWINAHVTALDNKTISYPFFTNSESSYQIPVVPNRPHLFTVHGQFNRSYSDGGPYESFAAITATLAPKHHYVLRAAVNGVDMNMWIQTKGGKKVSAVVAVPYQAEPKDETIVVQ